MIIWTLEQGIEIVRTVEAIAINHGFHCALAGSVLQKGESEKDLDIILYPRKTSAAMPFQPLIKALTAAGFLGWERLTHLAYGDDKIVFRTEFSCARVEFFLMQ